MIRIFTALYCEAQPLIQYYHLKKNNDINMFQVFQNEDILLVITNTGSIAAAVGVSHLCTLFPPANSDFLVNIGICGTGNEDIPVGGIFLCNKITEEMTNRSFYPDIIFKHPFVEKDIITCSKIVGDTGSYFDKEQNAGLFDMEAAGIYQAAAYYFQPHQISFIKIVSDYGTEDKLNPEKVTALVNKNMNCIAAWLESIGQIRFTDKPVFSPEEEACIRNMAFKLQCSVTMEYKLRQQLRYYKLVNGSFMEVIDEFCFHNQLPCKTKAEGKMYFEQLTARLI